MKEAALKKWLHEQIDEFEKHKQNHLALGHKQIARVNEIEWRCYKRVLTKIREISIAEYRNI